MCTCMVCHFATALDDIVLSFALGGCVCLRCYRRETRTTLAMPPTLRRAISAALAAAD